MKRSLLLLITFLITFRSYTQSLISKIDLDKKVSSSSLIIEGEVIAQHAIKLPSSNLIYTISEISVYTIFKGTLPEKLTIATAGGTLSGEKLIIPELLKLSSGEKGLFFCKPHSSLEGVYEVYASKQGFYKADISHSKMSDIFQTVDRELLIESISRLTREKVNVIKPIHHPGSSRAIPVITDLSPNTITAGTNSRLTITGSGFGNTRGAGYVEFSDADKGGSSFIQAADIQYISWSDSQIIVEVPSEAGTGEIRVSAGGLPVPSQESITVPFARTQIEYEGKIYSPTMVNQLAGGYPWRMYSGFENDTLAKSSFLRAFTRWRCTSGVNWFIGSSTEIDKTDRDNINIIRFDNGEELPAGVLGTCYSYYQACTAGQWYIAEYDIIFDDGANWEYGPEAPAQGEYDFESVAFHELGHGHQLGHVIDPNDVMHFSIADQEYMREPNQNDKDAAQLVMTQSNKGLCNLEAMKPITADVCGDPSFAYFKSEPPRIYPVPVSDLFHITYFLTEDQEIDIKLFDVSGKIIAELAKGHQKKGEHTLSKDLRSITIKSGVYILKSVINGKEYSTRLIAVI